MDEVMQDSRSALLRRLLLFAAVVIAVKGTKKLLKF
jgi:hypothetical protein